MATAEATLDRTEKQDKSHEVRGTMSAEDYATLSALVRTCGYPNMDAFVSEAVAEKVKSVQAKVQAQFGPKKKK